MDWEAAERRASPGTVEGRLWAGLRRLVEARRSTPALHAHGTMEPLWTGNEHVFGLLRAHAGDRHLLLANFTAGPQRVRARPGRGARPPARARRRGRPTAGRCALVGDELVLEPYQFAWLGR